MVVSHDSGRGGTRGRARVMLDSPDLAGTGLRVEQFDDQGAQNHSGPDAWHGICANSDKDCFSFDQGLGTGYFSWQWGAGGSDGMLFGAFPTAQAYSFTLRYLEFTGLERLRIGSWDVRTSSVVYHELTPVGYQSHPHDVLCPVLSMLLSCCPGSTSCVVQHRLYWGLTQNIACCLAFCLP